ncbi:MAG: TonB-dependent receptor domain-containing protein, partial [Terriglobales bacterium]
MSYAQSTNATITGRVIDQSNSLVPGAKVEAISLTTNVHYSGETNREGLFTVASLPPGPYRIEASKAGFKTVVRDDVVLRVQDIVALNFILPVGSVAETVTVTGGAPLLNTQDATVSTVIDRQFVENIPLNGRSFQSLVQLTPGVVLTVNNGQGGDGGQFSVNGQRADANYWTVDGVSANIGISGFSTAGDSLSGSLGSYSAVGGTNSLVSVDAMQEFRIQTSTYAPEFGRSPGAQISIVTRSGTNQFHGSAFDYLRNDVLDANDWFGNFEKLKKPEERQNDFGGVLGGPITIPGLYNGKDKTFFFFSYEGLRLRLPQVLQTYVPDLTARQNAIPAMQPYLSAYPLPNGADNSATGVAQFNASYSNAATLDAYSLRIDHNFSNKVMLFARGNYSPSSLAQRGLSNATLSSPAIDNVRTATFTAGSTWAASTTTSNDLRFNYSRVSNTTKYYLSNFGGATPLSALPFPSPYTANNGQFGVSILSLGNNFVLSEGKPSEGVQRQFNIVDNVSVQRASHNLKFGADYRRLTPTFAYSPYVQTVGFSDVPSAETGSLSYSYLTSSIPANLVFRNLGLFAQDTWRVKPRLTITYGLRWDLDVAPSSSSGPSLLAVTGFNINDPSSLALAPSGTPPFKSNYTGFAPRIGVAYELRDNQRFPTALRGGIGIFYDLATSQVGNAISQDYPFGATRFSSGGSFPLDATTAAPLPITSSELVSGTLFAFDPNLQLPYTLQWNLALEQGLGVDQSLSASWIGAAGRRLLQSSRIFSPNARFGRAQLVTNTSSSDYDALQVQYRRRLVHGFQALASYTWSHSIDTASAASVFGNEANTLVPAISANVNRGPSDFDIRHAASAAFVYEVPVPRRGVLKAIAGHWSTDNTFQIRSSLPVNLYYSGLRTIDGALTFARPDVVPGAPLYLYGAQCVAVLGPPCAGGKGLDPAAFTSPPIDPNTNRPSRQGTLGRNALRGFGAFQWDFAVHREFPIDESLKLQFRAEMFNVLN